MKLVKVESIPETIYDHTRQRLRELLDDFLKSDMKYAQVILDVNDYGCIEYARSALVAARQRYGYHIDIMYRNGSLYVAKRGV
jgi:hypothetical protein